MGGPAMPARDLRGTWPRALGSLAGSILLILTIRWACFEPYVIPSGSMIPALLVHDHILVNKFAYGLRLPFTTQWLLELAPPKRGDIVVFRSIDDSNIFLIKRVIGLPGEEIAFRPDGVITVNGREIPRRLMSEAEVQDLIKDWPSEERAEYEERYDFFIEDLDGVEHAVLRLKTDEFVERSVSGPYQVPERAIFMIGDNRDNSSDSRVWGALPMDNVLGRASLIWLSCDETLGASSESADLQGLRSLCNPQKLRWPRIGKALK
jgi:signal peptidase I